MKIRLLGLTKVEGDGFLGGETASFSRRWPSRSGDPLTVDQLSVVLWGDQVPASATKVVQGAVMRLRRVLGQDGIETTSAGYRLAPGVLDFDITHFETLVAQARELLTSGEPSRAAASFEQALPLWRGAPLTEPQEWDEAGQRQPG